MPALTESPLARSRGERGRRVPLGIETDRDEGHRRVGVAGFQRLQPLDQDRARGALCVVQDDGDDRGPAGEKRTHDGGSADDPGDQAEGVQGVDDVRQFDQGLA
jgi:hypothetical protein